MRVGCLSNHTQPLHTRKAEYHDLSMCQACGVEKYMAQSLHIGL